MISLLLLLYILDLFSYLLDFTFHIHNGLDDPGIPGLGGDGIGFPVHLLDQEIQPPSHRFLFPEQLPELG